MKTCTKCKETKALDLFYVIKRNGVEKGHTSTCRACTNTKNKEWAKTENGKVSHDKARKAYRSRNVDKYKDYELNRAYGISLDDYNSMREKQNYCCAICSTHESKAVRGLLYVDHCHETSVVRGLLCSVCNKALGLFKDNPEFLLRAVSYLKGKSV